jgi:proline iminopeptidase
MRSKMVIIIGAVVLVLVIAGFLFWRSLGEPLYTPGMVRAEKNLCAPLEPQKQPGDDSNWLVEPDIRLFYYTQGTGRPILLIHGGPGYPIHGPLVGLEPLSTDYRFYYYDQRGCGRSTKPFDRFESSNFYANMKNLERTLGIGAQVADIERIRRILGQEKLILMGHSFGAFLASMYAAEFAEHVDAMVLVAPAGVLVVPDEAEGFFEEIRRRLPNDKQSEYDQFINGYLDFASVFTRSEAELARMNRQLGDYFLTATGRPAQAGDANIPQDNGGWIVQALYFSMGKRHDYRAALKQVTARTLVIHGEGDVSSERVSRMYADGITNSHLHVMKGGRTRGGHFPFSEQPEVFAEVVSGFLAGRPWNAALAQAKNKN